MRVYPTMHVRFVLQDSTVQLCSVADRDGEFRNDDEAGDQKGYGIRFVLGMVLLIP
ncbi:MAG: hypothetical protein ACLU4N_19420 [Butyricimonas faecihominis]